MTARRLTGNRRIRPVEDRFWPKVEKSDGCWTWVGAITAAGYGNFSMWDDAGFLMYRQAHRVAYELLVGPIPAGLVLDHLCRNRACVNPAHLEPVTEQVNIARGFSPAAIASRQPTCPHGHPWAINARFFMYKGKRIRQCRACGRARQHAWRVRKRLETGQEFQRADAGGTA